MELYQLSYSAEDIIRKRQEVMGEFLHSSLNIKTPDIKFLTSLDIKILFNIYDKVFLMGYFKAQPNFHMNFSVSSRLSKSAGKTIMKREKGQTTWEIRMGQIFFTEFKNLNGNGKVNGLVPKDALEALCLVLEHEICHVIEFYYFKTSSCRGKRFKSLAYSLFGHKETYHELLPKSKLEEKSVKLKIGDKVSIDFKDKTVVGIISNINKRATVMVFDENGIYRDSKGIRYSKFYVPVGKIIKKIGC